MKKLILLLFIGLAPLCWGGEEMGLNWNRVTNHQSGSNTTWTPTNGSVRLNTLVFNVSAIGTSWIITVKDKSATPLILWSGTAALGTTTVVALPVGIWMNGGIDVTFSGTAGTADFFATFR